MQESAYSAIGSKFKSVTSLELYQLPLERHYKPITAMINAWGEVEKGGGDSHTNQLTELKIFHSKELYSPDGTQIK